MASHRATAAVALILSSLALVGCGSSQQSSADPFAPSVSGGDIAVAYPDDPSMMSEPMVGMAPPMAADESMSVSATRGQEFSNGAADVTLEDREIVRTASMSVTVDDVAESASTAEGIVAASGGFVSQSRTDDYFGGTQSAFLVVRVPANKLDAVMDSISDLGNVQTAETNMNDVTAQSIDIDAQIKATEASIARLTELMTQAGSLENLMRIEQELTFRQGTLDSLRGQKAALDDQVAMSTLNVAFTPTVEAEEPKDPADEPIGFVAAFKDGWTEFEDWAARTATNLGYAAPFVLFFLFAVGIVLEIVWIGVSRIRRRTRSKQSVGTTPADSQNPRSSDSAEKADAV